MQKAYTDFDYRAFPVPDLFLDKHWIQLPAARYAEIQRAQREAEEQALLAPLPDHKVILIPADSQYSPSEEELWPIINHTVQQCLRDHPAAQVAVTAAVDRTLAEYRGFTNPYPASLDYQPPQLRKK